MDAIETEKSRIVLHELEPGWWILASVDLTCLPSTRNTSNTPENPRVDYSSREVATSELILQHLLRANTIFLLHHGSTLSDFYKRSSREKFCTILERFWTRFIWNWDVLLHGNPAVDVYNGTKLAVGGELGIGVGEEEWGSAEREVLEGYVGRTDGLLDLVVSRFGDAPKKPQSSTNSNWSSMTPREPWLGIDEQPRASDGVVFTGIGTINKTALSTVSHWMEWIYKYGEKAYGVGENPSTVPRKKRQMAQRRAEDIGHDVRSTGSPRPNRHRNDILSKKPPQRGEFPGVRREVMHPGASSPLSPPGIPPPLVAAVEASLEDATSKVGSGNGEATQRNDLPRQQPNEASSSGTDKMMKYLTLGYGSAWSFSSMASAPANVNGGPTQGNVQLQKAASDMEQSGYEQPLTEIDPAPEVSDDETQSFIQNIEPSDGRFIIGLLGNLDGEADSLTEKEAGPTEDAEVTSVPSNSRIMLRTLNLELAEATFPQSEIFENVPEDDDEGRVQSHSEFCKVQVAIYIHQPFIFLFIFELHTPTLSYPSFYRNLDHQLGPLQRPLLDSTDPIRALKRMKSVTDEHASLNLGNKLKSAEKSVYELVYDPRKRTIRSSIPNIPSPGTFAAESLQQSQNPYATGSWLTLGIPTSQAGRSTSTATAGVVNRIQALSIHTHILNMHASTRRLPRETERSIRTSRGYWIIWMRIPPHISESEVPTSDIEARVESLNDRCKEVYLVRKAEGTESGPTASARKPSAGNRWLIKDRDVSGSSAGTGGDASVGPTEEVVRGFDARRYVDALLALNG